MKRDIYWQQMNLNLSDRLILLISGVFLLGKVFVAMELIEVETLNRWLCLSEDFSLFVKRPFTILTYAFYHVSFEHFLGNMLFLFFIGRIWFHFLEWKRFWEVFLVGIITGGVLFLGKGYFFWEATEHTMLLGTSGGIMSLLAYMAIKTPRHKVNLFTLSIPLIYLFVGVMVLDMFNFTENPGGKIAHLGGAIGGLIYALLSRYNVALRKIFLNDKEAAIEKKKAIAAEQQRIKQLKVNKLLEKIGVSGYESLTDAEKKFLFEASRDR